MKERRTALSCPATALQLERRVEQKASLGVSSPAAEVNPERPGRASTPPAVEGPVRPSADAETKGDASELNLNDITHVELYKTCLSTLSPEGINTPTATDGNTTTWDIFQHAGPLGLIDSHQAPPLVAIWPATLQEAPPPVDIRPATLRVDSLEAASLGLAEGLEESSVARSHQTDLGSGGEKTWQLFPGEPEEGAGRDGGLRALSHWEEGERPQVGSGTGAGPWLRGEVFRAGMETERAAGGRERRAGPTQWTTSADHRALGCSEAVADEAPAVDSRADEAPAEDSCADEAPAMDSRADEAPAVDPRAPSTTLSEHKQSFSDLHRQSAPHATLLPGIPLAFSTPHPMAATNSRATDQPSPIPLPPASQHSPQSGGPKLREPRPAETPGPKQQRLSPLPEKPITATALEVTEKKSGRSYLSNTLSSGLEKLKNVTTGSISPIRVPGHGQEAQEAVKESKLPDPAVRYYHLTHDELIKKILQQELELQKKEEHVRDLEEYIDLLLVQIMEQNPSILQSVSEVMKSKTATD